MIVDIFEAVLLAAEYGLWWSVAKAAAKYI